MKHTPNLADSLLCCIIFAAATAPALAQGGTVSSRHTPAVTRDMRYREWSLKSLEKNGHKTEAEWRLAWTQIREDFERVQVQSLAARRAISAENPDYGAIASAAAEIRKCATRLKTNLRLPEPEQRPPSTIDGLRLRTMLSALDGLVVKFVRNPIFKDTEVVDAGEAVKAVVDLERIIEVSAAAKKSADGMKSKAP